ncbi:MAG TPA: nucleotide sugar dehydrogenase [Anaerolineales bacterium]
MKKICILGLGYIGLPTASMFATHGIQVLGVDVNEQVVATLRRGDIHIHEPGLRDLVKVALESGNLRVATDPAPADAFIIAAPTPFLHELSEEGYKKADMRFVISATEAILPHLRRGNLVVLESTSPPQTTAGLVKSILERSGMKAGEDFLLVYSPERVLPGQILKELVENARVIGGINLASAEAGRDLYKTFVKGDIILTDATTAEMVKLMENTYRDVNIAIANEFSRLADRFGVNVWDAISLANLHPRVKILNPGPGVGGHCISVDPWFFVEAAPDLASLIYAARKVNDAQPKFVFDLVQRSLGSLKNKKIAALGLAYKPDVDDLRESPALDIIRLLQNAGACVKAYEPFKPNANLPGITMVPALEVALQDADAVILLVNHTELRSLSPERLATLTPARVLIDTVYGWAGKDWAGAGFKIYYLGVGKKDPILGSLTA